MWYVMNVLQALWECIWFWPDARNLNHSGIWLPAACVMAFVTSLVLLVMVIFGVDTFGRRKDEYEPF